MAITLPSFTVTNLTAGGLTSQDFHLDKGQSKVVKSVTPWMLDAKNAAQISITPANAQTDTFGLVVDNSTGVASTSLILAAPIDYAGVNNNVATLASVVNSLVNSVNSLNNFVFNTPSM